MDIMEKVKQITGITKLCVDCLKENDGLIGFRQAELIVDRNAKPELVRTETQEGVKETWQYPTKLSNRCYYHNKKKAGKITFKRGLRIYEKGEIMSCKK